MLFQKNPVEKKNKKKYIAPGQGYVISSLNLFGSLTVTKIIVIIILIIIIKKNGTGKFYTKCVFKFIYIEINVFHSWIILSIGKHIKRIKN